MGFFEISSLAAAVFNTGLALLVVRRDLRSLLHRAYIAWAVSLTIWNVAAPVLAAQHTVEGGLFWARILQLGVIFMPISLLHLCLILTDSPRGRAISALYVAHCCFALCLPGSLFVAKVKMTQFGYWTVGGPVFHVFMMLYIVETVWLVMALNRKRQTAPARLR